MPGPHDFAVRISAVRLRVGCSLTNPVRAALRFQLRARRCHVHRIPPRVRDDREPPLFRVRRGELVEMICPMAKADYFDGEDWTDQITLKSLGKLRSARLAARRYLSPLW
jgi:hypothetical protein